MKGVNLLLGGEVIDEEPDITNVGYVGDEGVYALLHGLVNRRGGGDVFFFGVTVAT